MVVVAAGQMGLIAVVMPGRMPVLVSPALAASKAKKDAMTEPRVATGPLVAASLIR